MENKDEIINKTKQKDGSVVLTTYDMMLKTSEKLKNIQFMTAIFDQIFKLKNNKTKTYNAVKELNIPVKYEILYVNIYIHLFIVNKCIMKCY